MDTLQTQWSWLLQITKCIHCHLKENAAYSQVTAPSRSASFTALLVFTWTLTEALLLLLQFFKEANETYSKLQKEHETIRSKFLCDKNTSLENLVELLKNLEVSSYPVKSTECKSAAVTTKRAHTHKTCTNLQMRFMNVSSLHAG